jgi:hypothetical protein
MTIPKFLYHGTSAAVARIAMTEGLHPRKAHGKSNWKRTVESNPDTVYLTDAYPIYFAMNAARRGEQGAVLEIDIGKLDQLYLVPDEDVLEQAGRRFDGIEGSMRERTRHYRNKVAGHIATDAWLKSLAAMGTCGSLKPIPASAIKRVAFIDFSRCPMISMTAGDASICLGNYRFCGPKYRGLTQRLFGHEVEADPLGIGQLPTDLSSIDEQHRAVMQQMIDSRAEAERILLQELGSIEIVGNRHN